MKPLTPKEKKRNKGTMGNFKEYKVYVRKAFQQYKKGDEITLRNFRVVETLMAKGYVQKSKPKVKKDAASKPNKNGSDTDNTGSGETVSKG